MYSKGNSLEDIKSIINHAYKINLSPSFISELISKVSEDVANWQNRQLQSIYAMTYVDCLYATVKVDGYSKKVAVYVIIGIGLEEAIEEVYPLTKSQRCVVHITRNIYKVCNKKESKEVITDFKQIYKASSNKKSN